MITSVGILGGLLFFLFSGLIQPNCVRFLAWLCVNDKERSCYESVGSWKFSRLILYGLVSVSMVLWLFPIGCMCAIVYYKAIDAIYTVCHFFLSLYWIVVLVLSLLQVIELVAIGHPFRVDNYGINQYYPVAMRLVLSMIPVLVGINACFYIVMHSYLETITSLLRQWILYIGINGIYSIIFVCLVVLILTHRHMYQHVLQYAYFQRLCLIWPYIISLVLGIEILYIFFCVLYI
ncbi:hypothetical protein HMPREF0872_01665 [Veillonella montpellierensis DNF00314]|uniref:Uncharacterized protein n=1 Tax=Veillonella montpellierensis DNF00314 TaxID=1401067 RepID=A0A096ANJ5_9FIRM|nr:hypothetical protein HMPREF0872_01665 [Veillonella montpellierensis DNF00314]